MERLGAVERQVPVHLARRDVVEPLDPGAQGRLEQRLGAEDVGPEEPVGLKDGEAVVRFGGEVHHHLHPVVAQDLRDPGPSAMSACTKTMSSRIAARFSRLPA